MRTTLDIEDDVLAAAKELARRQRLSAGQLISRLLREAMSGTQRVGQAVGGGACRGGLGLTPHHTKRRGAHHVPSWLPHCQAGGASGAAPGTGPFISD